MGGCQNYGPFLGTLNNRCRIIIGTQKGTIILTTTHNVEVPAKAMNARMLTIHLFGFRIMRKPDNSLRRGP